MELPDLPLVNPDGTATVLMLTVWREAVRNLPTLRAIPGRLKITDQSGYGSREFTGLWRQVFGAPVPSEQLFREDGRPTEYFSSLARNV